MSILLNEYKCYFKSMNKNVRLYFGVLLIAAISSSAFSIIYGIYLKNLGYNEQIVGELLSLMTLGTALGALPVSAFAGRFSKRSTIVGGLVIMFATGLIMINIHYLLIMKIAAFIYGSGQASVMILQAPILYENTEEPQRITAFSIAFVLQNISFVISSYILGHASAYMGHFIGETASNAAVMNATVLIQIFAVYLTWQFTGASLNQSCEVMAIKDTFVYTYQGFKNVLSGGALLYVIQVAFIGFGAGLVVPFFSIYLKYTLHISDALVGTIMAISQAGTIMGGLIVSPLSRKFGRVSTVLACQILSIPFLFSISVPQGIIVITISFFFRSSLMNMASPIISNLSMDIVNEDARTHMSSVVAMTGNLFRALGIYVGGLMMYHISYNSPYYVTIVCYIVGTYIFYRTFKGYK